MVNVCYLISQGFAARMVLHSELVPALRARGVTVGVVTPNADEASMQALARDLDVELFRAQGDERLAASLMLNQVRRYLFEDVWGNKALRAKHLRDRLSGRRWQRGMAAAMLTLNKAAQRLPQVPAAAERMQRLLLDKPAVDEQLRRMQPDLVVATYPANLLEAAYLHHAQKAGMATAAHLLSWDNITCKGRFPVVAPRHITWGPIMTAELQEHYGLDPATSQECGVPHFDSHAQPVDEAAVAGLLEGLGLDPALPYLFLGMSSPVFAPREIDVVEWLAERVRQDAFGEQMQLVVRPHPQNVQGSMSDQSWLPRLEALRGPRVGLDIPNLEQSRLPWNMRRDDLPKLASLIAGCALCINSGSTLSIDAVLHDKPVIITAFDADEPDLDWHLSARRVVEYGHLDKLIGLGGVRVTQSYRELSEAITTYLDAPETDAAGRARTRDQECGACDGQAHSRVADALVRLVNEARPGAVQTSCDEAAQ